MLWKKRTEFTKCILHKRSNWEYFKMRLFWKVAAWICNPKFEKVVIMCWQSVMGTKLWNSYHEKLLNTVYSIRIICLWQKQVVVYKPCTQCHFGILVNWQTKFKKLWSCLPQHEKQNWHNWLLFSCLIDFCFEFLMLSFVVHFHKKWKTKYSSVCSYIYIYFLAKWLSVLLRTKWFWVRVQLQKYSSFFVFHFHEGIEKQIT